MWTPMIITDNATSRYIIAGTTEYNLYESGELTFDDLWHLNQPLEGQISLERGIAV